MIKYRDLEPLQIDVIQPLWERNREFHVELETDFKSLYQGLSFEDRMQAILARRDRTVKISIARLDEEIVGYCLSTADAEAGELVSMHVAAGQRGNGIGRTLALSHLAWMQSLGCRTISLQVSLRNHETLAFYESLGLRPCVTEMRLPPGSLLLP